MVNTIYNIFDVKSPEPKVSVELERRYPILEREGLLQIDQAIPGVLSVDHTIVEEYWRKVHKENGGDGNIFYNPNTPGLGWREKILTLGNSLKDGYDPRTGVLTLKGNIITAASVQAQRKGVFKSRFMEAGIYGIIVTKDNQLVFGKRGGSVSVDQIVSYPAGAIPFEESRPENPKTGEVYNPLEWGVVKEGEEEGALSKDEVEYKLIGTFRQEPGQGVALSDQFVYLGNTDLSSNEVLDRHKKSIALYREHGGGTSRDTPQELAARTELAIKAKKNPIYAADAWENAELTLVENDPGAIIKHVSELEGAGHPLLHGMKAALPIYVTAQFGRREARKLMDLEQIASTTRGF